MATRADVARLAGVSPATVSYAMSGKAPISEETRERVFAAMRELQYTPNVMAQALAGRRSRIITMLLPGHERGISNADLEYMLGAAGAARELGYHLLLWPTDDRDVDEVVSLGQAGLLDGAILMEVRMDDERVKLLTEAQIPFSLVGRTSDPIAHPLFTDRDFEAAIRKSVEYLVGLGHRHIAFLNSPRRTVRQGLGASVRADSGFKAAVKEFKVKGVTLYAEANVPAGRKLAQTLLNEHPEVTGIVELNSEAIIGFMQEAARVPIAIPERLSIVSINASDVLAEATEPALTNVAPPSGEMGRMAAQMLIAKLSGTPLPSGSRLFIGELVERASSGPAPAL